MENEKDKEIKWVTKKSWDEFRETGLIWFINSILHLFGWAIVYDVDEKDHSKILDVYPARVKYRGFCKKVTTRGYQRVTEYLKKEIDKLLEETYL